MGFKEVQGLDADVTVALGKKNKETGKPYPKTAEGYYLGSRTVENKRGESKLHFLQTPDGNLGVWGTTDLNRKLSQVVPGTMIRITSTGTKAVPNGEMYTYKVELDTDNSIDVSLIAAASENTEEESSSENGNDDNDASSPDEDDVDTASLMAAERAAKAAKVQEILKKGKKA